MILSLEVMSLLLFRENYLQHQEVVLEFLLMRLILGEILHFSLLGTSKARLQQQQLNWMFQEMLEKLLVVKWAGSMLRVREEYRLDR